MCIYYIYIYIYIYMPVGMVTNNVVTENRDRETLSGPTTYLPPPLSLSHTHTHTHIYIYIYILKICNPNSLVPLLSEINILLDFFRFPVLVDA
jgi:hypothetical protein